ncbi:MAG TPA: LysR family transcriptional regulator [Candidatus Baltobacteraceae bacterium]|jgi:DNA-binding transcriptional LysR family regulator|nr:LysR family transcriptional regulator [Candidatus Baltobacteraceae bacterium]
MAITLAQLQALRALALHGSFTRAADSLGVTQPAVSQQIAALARALDLRLVETVEHRPRLTNAGRFVSERADELARGIDALVRESREYAAGERGTLHIAATLTIGNYLLPSLIASFCRRYENVSPRVQVVNTETVGERIRNGDASLGLIEGRLSDDLFAVEPFAQDRMVVVLPAHGHRLSNATRLRAGDLADEPFVSREIGSGTRGYGYDTLVASGVRPRLVLELPGGEAIVRAVEAGLGIAILSERVVARAAALGAVKIATLEDLPMERDFSVVYVRERVLPPVGQAFALHVHQAMATEE